MSMDTYYSRIFESDLPELYLNSLSMLALAKRAVVETKAINVFYAADWYYHLACISTILLTRKEHPKPSDIGHLDLKDVTFERLKDLIPLVSRHLAGSRQSTKPLRSQAESPLVTTKLLKETRDLLRNSRWSDWPASQVVDDFVPVASRLDPGRRF
jgi:hypothetical protein